MIRKIIPLACLVVLISSCAPVISQTTMKDVDKNVSFTTIQRNPDAMKGRVVLLGGEIIATTPGSEETWIEVLEKPLDFRQKPSEEDVSSGRFLVRFEGFLDPAIYEKGRKLTVAGVVEGKIVRPIGEIDYIYPVIAVREHHLWKPDYDYGLPRVGIGVGGGSGHVGGGVGVGF